MIKVMTMDAGFRYTGIVQLQYNPDSDEWEMIADYLIKTEKESAKRGIYVSDDEVRRIQYIADQMDQIDKDFNCDIIVAELPTGGGRSATPLKSMAFIKAVIATVAKIWNVPLVHVKPDDIKIFLCGKKTASKKEIEDEVIQYYPTLIDKYKSTQAKSGWKGEFEHVADAIGAFLTVENDPIIQASILPYKK